jgi:predicted anti-sigma-YlaC factor YlaD
MNCPEFHEHLQRRLDGLPIADNGALARHLADCPDCRALNAAATRLGDGLRLLPMPVPPVGLSAHIATQVLAERRRSRQLRQVLALAAGLLLAVAVGSYAWRPAGPSEVARVQPPDVAPAGPSLQESVAEAGSAVVSLTRRTAAETVEPTRLLWQDFVALPTGPDAGVLEDTLDPPARSLREAGQNVASALEPVTTSARRAVNLFLRTPGS